MESRDLPGPSFPETVPFPEKIVFPELIVKSERFSPNRRGSGGYDKNNMRDRLESECSDRIVKEDEDDSKRCAICLASPQIDPSIPGNCPAEGKHKFCFPCLREWFKAKASCPLCSTASNYILHFLNVPNVNDGNGEKEPLSKMKKEFAAEMISSRSIDTPLSDEDAALSIYLKKLKTRFNIQFEDPDAPSVKRRKKNWQVPHHVEEKRKKMIDVINHVKQLRENIAAASTNRQTLANDPVFRAMIFEENLSRSDLSSNDLRRPFTVKIARDEMEDIAPRLRPWIQRDLMILLENSTKLETERYADVFMEALSDHPINSPGFEAVCREYGVPQWAIQGFCEQLFDFASSNLPMNLHDNNSQFRHPEARQDNSRNRNNNAEVIHLDDSTNGAHENEDILFVDDADSQRGRRQFSAAMTDSEDEDTASLYVHPACRLPQPTHFRPSFQPFPHLTLPPINPATGLPRFPPRITAFDRYGVNVQQPRNLSEILSASLSQFGQNPPRRVRAPQTMPFVDDVVTLSSDEEGRKTVDEIRKSGRQWESPSRRRRHHPATSDRVSRDGRSQEPEDLQPRERVNLWSAADLAKENPKKVRRSYSRSSTDTEDERTLQPPRTQSHNSAIVSSRNGTVPVYPRTFSAPTSRTPERPNSKSSATSYDLTRRRERMYPDQTRDELEYSNLAQFKKRVSHGSKPLLKHVVKNSIVSDMRSTIDAMNKYLFEVENMETYEESKERERKEKDDRLERERPRRVRSQLSSHDVASTSHSHESRDQSNHRTSRRTRNNPNYRDDSHSYSRSESEHEHEKEKKRKRNRSKDYNDDDHSHSSKRHHSKRSKKSKRSKTSRDSDDDKSPKRSAKSKTAKDNAAASGSSVPNKIAEADPVDQLPMICNGDEFLDRDSGEERNCDKTRTPTSKDSSPLIVDASRNTRTIRQ